ncbi:PIG-L deacetylase family protein [Phytohabitans rumicis]|uniref:GlcNAc-PI de-N-acetylase n=1 Tax=Phytohabitans rumicis TaxID=1076125 RepID=A0A6V8KTQ6_9ACTN|nr:PIG-L family deacetylase [Phytohabitans rumicis]GFJ87204.1 GlcNAc-PI de-N-acetylase [Phytohabitans rumicis]
MTPFELAQASHVVAIGAHPDDIEIGAGGLLLNLPAGVPVRYVVCTGTPQRHAEAQVAAEGFLAHAAVSHWLHDLPDGHLPAHTSQVKQILEDAARGLDGAVLVLAPARDDAHQDHRLIAELAPTCFRDALILHYEIPKYDGDLSRRNLYLPMDESTARRKVELLNHAFPSQKQRFDDEVFLGLARLRGMECRTRYAEAYTCDKAVLRLSSRHAEVQR